MTNVAYNTNIPFASNSPSQDQPRMQENTNSLKSLIEIDHIGFGNNQGGYHQTIHQPFIGLWNQITRVATPPLANVVGVNEIVSMNVLPNSTGAVVDTQLFNVTGLGGVSQLSGNNLVQEGYAWVGGILVMWGTSSATTSGSFASGTAQGNIVFKDRVPGAIPFPSTCFVVLTSLIAGGNTVSGSLSPTLISATGFSWAFKTSSALNNFTGFYWIAIGV